jgi:hypothetical protein
MTCPQNRVNIPRSAPLLSPLSFETLGGRDGGEAE